MRANPWLVVVLCTLASVAHATGTTEGRLVTRARGDTVDVPLIHTDVKIRVDGYLADATVTQQFDNPYASPIEAIYLFPLPDHAAVTELTITIGARTIHGAIHERAQAKQIYEAAKQRGLLAALMTEQRPNLFTQEIANLEPHVPVAVTIRYVEPLAYADGGYQLDFPMVAIPRYAGSADVTPQAVPAGQRSGRDIALAIELDAGVAIESIESPSHRIAVHGSHVELADDDRIPNKDFVLRYRVAGAAPKFGVLSYRDGDVGSFLFVAQPPAPAAATAVAPREIIFALDTSSSMRGAPLAKAKQLIHRVLATLRPDDTFQIVRFDDTASALAAAPIANKPNNLALALDWVDRLEAGGGTEMTTGVDAALALPHDPARLRIVAFVTDGYVGNEDEILRDAAAKAGAARLFAFGVGSAVNHYLLDELADAGRGTAQYVRPDEDTATVVEAFRARIDAPVLTDLSIDWAGLAVTDVVPHSLPDLFVGQPLAISGHFAHGGSATVTVHARQDGRDVSFAVPVTLADRDPARPAIAQVWTRRRIAELERAQLRKDDPARVRDIVALSLAAHVLTRYTAFVAVDSHDANGVHPGGAAPRRVVVPIDVPEGGTGYGYGTIGGGSYASYSDGYGVGGGLGGMAARSASAPIVTVAMPAVVGSLDKTMIRRFVKRQLQKIRYCYEQRLPAAPTLEGVVMVTFEIGEDGKVTTASATGVDDQVASCIAGVVSAIEFPPARGGGLVVVHYPFELHPNVVHESVGP